MKTILIVLSFLLIGQEAYQQSIVTIKVIGNRNKQLVVEGKTYTVNNSSTTAESEIIITDLAAGQHTIEMVRNNQYSSTKASFITRDGYDLQLNLAANGSISTTETRTTKGINNGKGQLTTAAYNTLLSKVKAKAASADRAVIIENHFTTTNKKLTAAQASQLIKLVNTESLRLKLAKLSYNNVSDTSNFSLVSNLLNSSANRTVLTDYVKSQNTYDNDGETEAALTSEEFAVIYREVLAETTNAERLYYLTNFFDRETNFYTAAQASQLLSLVTNQADKITLITKARRGVTDKENFTSTGTAAVAMTDANFTKLLNSAKSTYSISSRNNFINDAFKSTTNYFTVAQARQLLLLVNAENDRLPLAKNAWDNITDQANYTQLYDLFSSTSNRNDLTAYVNTMTGTGTTTVPVVKTAMSDTDYNTLYKNLQFSFGIGAKYSSLTEIFNTTTNYFTVAQTKKLLQLISSETNRLELAKLSYDNVTDTANFPQVYDLFPTPANKTALTNYVNSVATTN